MFFFFVGGLWFCLVFSVFPYPAGPMGPPPVALCLYVSAASVCLNLRLPEASGENSEELALRDYSKTIRKGKGGLLRGIGLISD